MHDLVFLAIVEDNRWRLEELLVRLATCLVSIRSKMDLEIWDRHHHREDMLLCREDREEDYNQVQCHREDQEDCRREDKGRQEVTPTNPSR